MSFHSPEYLKIVTQVCFTGWGLSLELALHLRYVIKNYLFFFSNGLQSRSEIVALLTSAKLFNLCWKIFFITHFVQRYINYNTLQRDILLITKINTWHSPSK